MVLPFLDNEKTKPTIKASKAKSSIEITRYFFEEEVGDIKLKGRPSKWSKQK